MNTLSYDAWKAKVKSIEPKAAEVPDFLQCMAYQLGMTPEEAAGTDVQATHDTNVQNGVHPDLSNNTVEEIMEMSLAAADQDN